VIFLIWFYVYSLGIFFFSARGTLDATNYQQTKSKKTKSSLPSTGKIIPLASAAMTKKKTKPKDQTSSLSPAHARTHFPFSRVVLPPLPRTARRRRFHFLIISSPSVLLPFQRIFPFEYPSTSYYAAAMFAHPPVGYVFQIANTTHTRARPPASQLNTHKERHERERETERQRERERSVVVARETSSSQLLGEVGVRLAAQRVRVLDVGGLV